MLSSSFFLVMQHVFLLSSTICRAQKENKYCHQEPSAVAKLQGLIFEEELIKEEVCFMVSLKQLLKSIFLKVWVCARLSHPKSRLLPPRSQLCRVLAEGTDEAGVVPQPASPQASTPWTTPATMHREYKTVADSQGYSLKQKYKAWVCHQEGKMKAREGQCSI